jgi:hypothetical protein
MKRDGLMLGLAIGAGALALLSMRREAKAAKQQPPSLEPIGGEGTTLASSAAPPLVADPAPQPAPVGGAALPAWNRKAGEADPPLHIPDDVEALARVITSEVGRGPIVERVAIGWVARNRARKHGVGVARLVCQPCGKSSGNRRPFSSARPATLENRELAALILASPQGDDPTGGATSCFEPALQDRLHAAGKNGHGLDARGIRYCWLRRMDYYGSVGRWDLFGEKGGQGARPVPAWWKLDGFAVCCSHDQRAACNGKKPGDRLEV